MKTVQCFSHRFTYILVFCLIGHHSDGTVEVQLEWTILNFDIFHNVGNVNGTHVCFKVRDSSPYNFKETVSSGACDDH